MNYWTKCSINTTLLIYPYLLDLQSGSILVDGVEVKNNIKSWQKNIGFVPQQVYLDDDNIKKNIALCVTEEKIDKDRVLKSLRDSKLLDFVDKQKDGIETKVGELGSLVSGGQLQRLGIARVYTEIQIY